MALAATVGIDAFAKVNAAIDQMVKELLVEQKDEVKHRDFCIEEFAQNDKQQAVAQDELGDLTAEIETLTSTIDTLTKDIAAAETENAESKTQMTRASEDREAQNKEFQETVADQRATQAILQKALERLQQVYGQSFIQSKAAARKATQEPGAEAPPPPAGFDEYKQSKHSGGVMGMIQQVIDEAKTMENDAIRDENDSHAAYENFIQNSNASITALMKAINDKTEKKSQSEANLIRAKEDQHATFKEAERLNEYKGTLHKSCDFVMDNFTGRQEARSAEVEALRQAKDILSGAQ